MFCRLLVPGKGAAGTSHASSSTERASTPLQQPHLQSCTPTEPNDIQPSAVPGLSYSSVGREFDAPIQLATNANAAHRGATAASQLPTAANEPSVTANQQSHEQHVTASASRWADSGSPNAQADVADVAAQPSERMHAVSLQAGSQEGVVMLLCILSLMPRLPLPPNQSACTCVRTSQLSLKQERTQLSLKQERTVCQPALILSHD